MEELRKRKRGADEAKAKNLISERAAALMEESLKNKGFIAERGFKNIISFLLKWWRRENDSLWKNTKNLDVPLW